MNYKKDSIENITDVTGYVYYILTYLEEKYRLRYGPLESKYLHGCLIHICIKNYSIEYAEAPDGAYGAITANGSWNGLVGMLYRDVSSRYITNTKVFHLLLLLHLYLLGA